MTTRLRSWAAAAAVCLAAAGIVSLAGDAGLVFLGEGTESIDLADLRDGETRIFGSGERSLTAIREGDTVRITREGSEDTKPLSITCRVGSDSCSVILSEDGERIAMKIEKFRGCDDDDCDESHDVRAIAGGLAGEELHWVHGDDGPGGVVVLSGGGKDFVFESDRVRLACPEGDATLTVEREEAEMTFLCPKHSLPMEKQVREGHMVLIETAGD